MIAGANFNTIAMHTAIGNVVKAIRTISWPKMKSSMIQSGRVEAEGRLEKNKQGHPA